MTTKKWDKENPERKKELERRCVQKVKLEVFSHYCKGTPYCQCPGCRNGKKNPVEMHALQIDHIDGKGSKHKRWNQRLSGAALYRWLKRNNYPEGFQVLCANCNNPAAKRCKEQCPKAGQKH